MGCEIMKKNLIIGIIIILVVSFSGCVSSSEPTPQETKKPEFVFVKCPNCEFIDIDMEYNTNSVKFYYLCNNCGAQWKDEDIYMKL